MDDVPWIYVAMIFIAFISWLRGRLQDAAAVRRERAADRKAKERARRTTEPEYESPYSARDRAPEPEVPHTFTQIFKEIERQINEAEEPPPPPRAEPQQRSAAPPPLPSSEPSYQPTEIPVPVAPSAPMQRRKKKRKVRVSTDSQVDSLTASLSNGGKLRTALILKEVLDKPRALQPRR